jgi:hypothetical protein
MLMFASALQAAPPPHEHDHAAHAANDVAPAPVPASPWETDAALRKGMGEVRAALADLRHHEMGHMPASMAAERADGVLKAIDYIFTHCELAPDADAAMHRMLVPLLAAAQRLKKDSSDVAAVAAMRDAVADYPRQFDDPLWTSSSEITHEAQ